MRKPFKAVILSACATAILLVLGAPPVSAHNTLDESVPAEGDVLESPPSTWTLTFEKSVPLDSASGVVINGDGVRTSLSVPRHGSSDSTIVFDLPSNLTGSISARWRLVGTDGHVISGRVSFSVDLSATGQQGQIEGSAGSVFTPPPNNESVEPIQEEWTTTPEPIRVVLRLFGFLFLLLLGGIFFVDLFIAEGAAHTSAGRRMLLLGSIGVMLVPLLQFWSFVNDLGGSVGDALSLTPGVMLLVRSAVGCALIGASTSISSGRTTLTGIRWQVGLAWLTYLVALAYGGHSRSRDFPWLGIPADVLHVTAISAWLGGLAALVFAVLPSVTNDQGVTCFRQFSRLAERAVLVVALTGSIQTVRLHGNVSTLFSSTHGILLLAKLLLVALILRFAARNRTILKESHDPDLQAHKRIRSLLVKSALKETVIASGVLLITSVMIGASLD